MGRFAGVLVVAGALLFAASGCSDLVGGAAQPGPAGSSTTGSSSAVPTSLAVSRSRSTAPTSRAAATTLDCPEPVMTTLGANFCYTRPEDFLNVTSDSTYPNSDTFKTAVAYRTPTGTAYRDILVITSRKVPIDADTLTDDDLYAVVDDGIRTGQSGIVKKTPVQPIKVAGLRAFDTTLTFDNGTSARFVNVFRGDFRVAILCQWQKYPRQVAVGCERVLLTLRVIAR